MTTSTNSDTSGYRAQRPEGSGNGHPSFGRRQGRGDAATVDATRAAAAADLYDLALEDSSPPVLSRTFSAEEKLSHLLQEDVTDLDTYGVTEFRDGFFDALFARPADFDRDALLEFAETTLPFTVHKGHLFSLQHLHRQLHTFRAITRRVTTSRAGIRLLKSFLAVFAAYILCLVPVVRAWLGRYNYILVVSCIINHPGRAFGAQLDGVLLTSIGSALGLGWGAFGLWISTSTPPARAGFGGVLAVFLCLFMTLLAFARSYYIRTYHFVLCAGMAVSFACLADCGDLVDWSKLRSYGICWALGQVLCLLVNTLLFPDAGAWTLASRFHDAFAVMLDGLEIPNSEASRTQRLLSQTFVNLSQAYRDFAMDISITRSSPHDVYELRNLMQAVVRSLMAVETETHLFDYHESLGKRGSRTVETAAADLTAYRTRSKSTSGRSVYMSAVEERAVRLVCRSLAGPTRELLARMRDALKIGDTALMDMSGYRTYNGPDELAGRLQASLTQLHESLKGFDQAETPLFTSDELPSTYTTLPGVVELFVFCRPIRQAAEAIEHLLIKIKHMKDNIPSRPRVHLPSYPLHKAMNRLNAQVRHDRGGITAGYYYKSLAAIAQSLQDVMTSEHYPLPQEETNPAAEPDIQQFHAAMEADIDEEPRSKRQKFWYKVWLVLHRLQGFETRYALKCVLVTILLSVPAWLPQSKGWWNRFESWWAVSMAWVMMHPRIGGTFQDLVTRASCGIVGALWSGIAYAAGNGNPYVMAVFAALYLIPMLYRFTQSRHARSGLIGCLTFAVISLSLVAKDSNESKARIASYEGLAFIVGAMAAVLINWLLWPFVARHELRKATSSMLFFLSVHYRRIVAQYVYYEEGERPTADDIERSEILEGRIREGFVRIRQLMELTRHEVRLRGPFDVRPYSALQDALERFFEYLVDVRQASLFFHPNFANDDDAVDGLLIYRRDAVAAILSNLYILSGALRAGRKVPKYLPSAAAARKRLLDKMAEVEATMSYRSQSKTRKQVASGKKWAQIYQYSFNESLTGCVTQLDELERYTKLIVGEQGFDIGPESEDSDLDGQ